jgi:hypothetical protein
MHLHRTDPRSILRLAESVIEARAFLAYTRGHPVGVGAEDWVRRAIESEAADLCGLFRCVCGNPFRRVVVDPECLTPTVRSLAAGIDAERAYDRLPILADALQEVPSAKREGFAGCDDAELLGHCRGAGPHGRGCWAVDLVLGRE